MMLDDTFPRIALKCPHCRRVVAETDGATRLYFGDEAYIERTDGKVKVYCQHCAAQGQRNAIHWQPKIALELSVTIDNSIRT